jgi:hypothetical protein
VARYTHDGLKLPTDLFEAAAYHYTVKVMCRCGHSATFDPHGLWWWFHRRGWDDRLRSIACRFWCRHCADRLRGARQRPTKVELVKDPPQITLPLPDQQRWKREIQRHRG